MRWWAVFSVFLILCARTLFAASLAKLRFFLGIELKTL